MALAFGESELIQLTDRDAGQVINDQVLNRAINAASAEINVWLAGRYVLPLQTVPDGLKTIAVDLARYHLYSDIQQDHPAAIRYGHQIRLLQSIAKGTASLGIDTAGAVPAVSDNVQISAGRNDFAGRHY